MALLGNVILLYKAMAAFAALSYRPGQMVINYWLFAQESSIWEILFLFFLYQWPVALLVLHIMYRGEANYGPYECLANLGVHSCFVAMLYKPFQIALVSAINATSPTLWEGLFVFAVFPAIIGSMWAAYGPSRLPEWQDVRYIYNFLNENWIIACLLFRLMQEAAVNYLLNALAGPHRKLMWLLLHIFFVVLAANFGQWCRQSPPLSRVLVVFIVLIGVLVQGAVYAATRG